MISPVFDLPASPTGLLDRLRWTLRDGWTLTRREFTQLRHAPGELVGAVIFPGIMVILFGYVFGSAISVPGGGNYREYLMPGLFAMTALAGVMVCALTVSKDVDEGVIDRFKSMPMARSAVPFGRAATDLITSTIAVAVMAGIGLLVGWQPHLGLWKTLAAFGLILLLRYAVAWVGVYIGLLVTTETADQLVPIVFPVSMVSNSFVPTSGMPGWLQFIANWNPVSALVQACRELFGHPSVLPQHASFPLVHPFLTTIGWTALLLIV
ncbi:MAG TPA: ABC transporter permease, partial [Nitrolancea sp.]|nr:ABC transporter permease [Nitrolancea sp.]